MKIPLNLPYTEGETGFDKGKCRGGVEVEKTGCHTTPRFFIAFRMTWEVAQDDRGAGVGANEVVK